MDEPSGLRSEGDAVLYVADRQPLRARSLAEFLRLWARDAGVRLVELDLSSAVFAAEPATAPTRRHVALIGVGGSRIRGSDLESVLHVLSRYEPSPVFAVVSDREDPEDVMTAFKAGARGFIPTSLDPQLAIHVIALLLDGGSYFPPSALAPAQRRRTKGRTGPSGLSHLPAAGPNASDAWS